VLRKENQELDICGVGSDVIWNINCIEGTWKQTMRKLIIGILLFGFTTGLAYPNQKIVIMAVRSGNIPAGPYGAALTGFCSYLDSHEIKPRVVEHDFGHEGQDSIVSLLSEIQVNKPELVFTMGTPATKAAQSSIKDIPLVFTMVLDPKRSGISVSGVSMDIPYEMILENLKKILPGKMKIGVIYSSQSASMYEEVHRASEKFGFQLMAEKIDSEKEFPDAIKALSRQMDCFLMLPDPKIYFPKSVEYLLRKSLGSNFATVGLSSAYTRAGALVSFDCDYKDLGKQTAELALEILAGQALTKTKIIGPRKVTFSLNLLVAERLKIEIPPQIVKEASEVFGK
jgi:putative ABC transport system substrate-binding protein